MFILYLCKSSRIGKLNILKSVLVLREFPKNFNFSEIIDSSSDHPQMLKSLSKILVGHQEAYMSSECPPKETLLITKGKVSSQWRDLLESCLTKPPNLASLSDQGTQ